MTDIMESEYAKIVRGYHNLGRSPLDCAKKILQLQDYSDAVRQEIDLILKAIESERPKKSNRVSKVSEEK